MRPRTTRLSRRTGYSLLELLVAIVLIDTGVLAIVQTHAVVMRRRNEIHARAAAVAAAVSRVEQLEAAPCAATSGAAASRGYDETWLVRPSGRTREISDSVAFGGGAAHRLALRTKLGC
jgi:Tfp pilus assembly protein PilV